MTEQTAPYKPSKKTRRLVMAAALIFTASLVAFIVYMGGDDPVRVTALYLAFPFASSIVWFYINGSSKDTESYNATLVKLKSAK